MEETQTNEENANEENTNWLSEEFEKTNSSTFSGDKKPALKLEENKTVEMTINFSKPFDKWNDAENDVIKKIIPVKVGDVELVWWLNVKNPVYSQIIKCGIDGKNTIKVLTIGKGKKTKYAIVD